MNLYHATERQENVCVLNAATANERYAVMMYPGENMYGVDVANWIYVELVQE